MFFLHLNYIKIQVQNKNPTFGRQQLSWRVRIVTPKQKDPTKKTLQKPYSPRTGPAAQHQTHCGPAPPRNTKLTVDLPRRRSPYSLWTCPTANTLFTMDLSHRGSPYSSWTYLTAGYPNHLGPSPPWNTLHPTQRGRAPMSTNLLT